MQSSEIFLNTKLSILNTKKSTVKAFYFKYNFFNHEDKWHLAYLKDIIKSFDSDLFLYIKNL